MSCSDQRDCIYIFLDALDECGETEQDRIIALVKELLKKNVYRIMITSRPHLKDILGAIPNSTLLLIRPNDVDKDVKTYVETELRGRRFLSQGLKAKIQDAVCCEAQGM